MKTKRLVILLIMQVLLSEMIAGQSGDGGRGFGNRTAARRVALVIGNSNYRNAAALPNPKNDAADMKAALETLGFEVIYGVDQNEQQMKALIRTFGERLSETKGVGLFYYAGHGIASGGENYLVPVDADIPAEDEIEDAAVSLSFLMNKIAAAENDLNIVILDACRNNPFARRWRTIRDVSTEGGLATIRRAPVGTLIAYATQPGNTADDGAGRNGLYTQELLQQIKKPNLPIEEVFKNVRSEVRRKSKSAQVPWESSSIEGNFYFSRSNTVQINPPSVPNKEPVNPNIRFIPYRKGDKWGFSDSSKNILIAPKYEEVISFKENLAAVKLAGKWGFINRNGAEIIPIKYNDVGNFSEGLAAVQIGEKWGYIDNSNKLVLPTIYEIAREFENGFARILEGGPSDIDKQGKRYPPIQSSKKSDTLTCVVLLGTSKYTFIDKTGKHITRDYDYCDQFSEGRAYVCLDGKCGYIDEAGKETIPLIYQRRYDLSDYHLGIRQSFSYGAALVNLNNKFGFIDKSGKEIISITYDSAKSFSEGIASVKSKGKWALIDNNGKNLTDFKFDNVWRFSEGLAAVEVDKKIGFVNRSGQFVINPKYVNGQVTINRRYVPEFQFEDGLAVIPYSSSYIFIGRDGTEYYEP